MAYAIVKTQAANTVANNTITKVVNFTQVDASAGGLWHNTNQRYEVPTGTALAWYDVRALVEWDGEQTGAHLVEACVNGDANKRTTLSQVDGDWSVTATTGLVHGGCAFIQMTGGDYLELRVRQISGASQSLAKCSQFAISTAGLS